MPALKKENVDTVNDLVLSQKNKLQTHRTVRKISRETGIHRSSLSQIISGMISVKFSVMSVGGQGTGT